MLASGQLAEAGVTFATGMLNTLRAWADEAVPTAALALARRESQDHLALWQQRNGGVSPAGV